MYDNIKLWFARNQDNNIIMINEINDSNKKDIYSCPICGSSLIPKAVKSKQVSSHFAHVDASKCDGESMIHFWLKHEFLEVGDKFKVVSHKEREYICKEVLVEKSYEVDGNIYRPDVTVLTECDNTIYFEMNYTNKKIIKDYLDIWLSLRNIVVEIDVKQLMCADKIQSFKALFYNGKCFNMKKNDLYYNTIGKHKENVLSNRTYENKERIKKLDWIWKDFLKHREGDITSDELFELIKLLDMTELKIIMDVLKRTKCSDLYTRIRERIELIEKWYFEEKLPIEKISSINKAIKTLNKDYQKINKEYTVKLNRDSNRCKDYYWFKGRKVGRWKTSSYSYMINLKLNDHTLKFEYIRAIISELNDFDSVYTYLANMIEEHKITTRCLECNKCFDITHREIKYFSENNLNTPKRCKSCRKVRKSNNSNGV